MMRFLVILVISSAALAQQNVRPQSFQFQDELSAPPVEDFLPSGYTTTTTETPTAPPLPSPVDAVPAGFDQRKEEDVDHVTNASQVEKAAEFQDVEDVDSEAKVENVRHVQAVDEPQLEAFESASSSPLAVEEEEEEEVREVVDNVDGHIEVHEEVVEEVVTDGPEPADEKLVDQLAVEQVAVEQVERLAPVEKVAPVERVAPVEKLGPVEQLEPVEQAEPVPQVQPVEDVEEFKPVEKVQPAKPQKLNRLRTKISEAKKPEKPEPAAPVELKKPEPQPCDSAVHDCEGCAIPKHARNCRVKYFKDQASIKACTDSTLIAKHILDQCPAKAKPVNPDPENY